MIQKNDEFTLEITDLGTNGEGIGKIEDSGVKAPAAGSSNGKIKAAHGSGKIGAPAARGDSKIEARVAHGGYTVFVKDALIGDKVRIKIIKAKKNYGYGRLMEIITPSPYRVKPPCPVARACGGCQIMHLDYKEQLRFKENKVHNLLERVGGLKDFQMLPILGMKEPYYYRNKAQFPVGKNKDGRIVMGFYAGRTHSIVDTRHCYIQHPLNEKLTQIIKDWMEKYSIQPYEENTGKGLVRHVLTRIGSTTGQVMVCLVINGNRLPQADALISQLTKVEGMTSICININRENTNVILGDQVRTLWGQPYITDYIGNIAYQISPLSFYQVNPGQTRVLYEKALEFADLKPGEVVWDLYCGIGTISLFLAQTASKVYGVEIVPQAIDDARNNARLNHMDNVEFFVGKAEEVLPREYEKNGIYADVIVVDPPRKGCDPSLLECMVKMAPKRIVYVSCDPATLARDLKYLSGNGYKVEKVQCVDMFGHSVHVETVVLLSHKKPDSTISVKVEFGEGEGKVPLDNIAKRAEAYKPKERVTYKMIKEYIEAKYGFKVHTAYIAEVKRSLGLPMYDAPNAVEELKQPRKHPTAEKVEAIKDALKHFEVI